jgi:beta-xylosidase
MKLTIPPLLRALVASASLLLLGASCGGGGGGAGDSSPPPAPPGPQTTSSIGDFPDPHVVTDGTRWYAYATNGLGRNVQLLRSDDRITWTRLPDAMPNLAAWARPGLTWAPEVMQVGGSWLLYYTARDRASERQCIGVAASASPEGPFVDSRNAPLVCQVAQGGSIDASPFRDQDGRLYLTFKNDGNCCTMPTSLYAQEMTADGLGLVGTPVVLLTNQPATWEGNVIEAPSFWRQDGRLLLFYSANDYAGAAYAVGYAECTTPLGPCTRASSQPVLKSRSDITPALIGPGHQTLFDAGGQTWLAYHAWQVAANGSRGPVRFLYIDRVDWNAGVPVVRGPTIVP